MPTARSPCVGGTRELTSRRGFADLAEVWLADLELRDLADGTKQNYRDQVRLHVLPAFEHFTLAEITTGTVEWFLKSQAAVSSSRARQFRTLLNPLFGFALRHDAIARNPVGGTSPLRRATNQPKALTLGQISAIRAAAASWRCQPGLPGPKPDGQVRDCRPAQGHRRRWAGAVEVGGLDPLPSGSRVRRCGAVSAGG